MGFLPIQSPRIALGFLVLFLLAFHPVNLVLHLKKHIDLGNIQLAEIQNRTDMAIEMITTSSPNVPNHRETEPTTPSPTDVPLSLPVLVAPNHPKPVETTVWCLLDHNNTNSHFRHFPHALQSLAPCWSFFCRAREERSVDMSCGIYIQHPPRFPWKDMSSWTKQLVEYMGCQVVVQSDANTPIDKVIVDGDVLYRPPDERKKPYAFFETKDHVRQLQARVLGDAIDTNLQRNMEGLRIGLLQRIRNNPKQASRIFLNLPNIRSQLQTAFPNATLVETDMRNFSLQQQALWWHQNDIVVAAHGAAITNCIFLRNHNDSAATVIEVYPDGFRPIIFGALMQSVGVHRLTISQNASISVGKNADLRPDPNLVVQLVQEALRANNLHMDRN
jgi:Glycosyltransferase 61